MSYSLCVRTKSLRRFIRAIVRQGENHMKKEFTAAILMLAFALPLTGCSSGNQSDSGPTVPDSSVTASSTMPILDQEGNRLGEIDSRAACTAADSGILYSIFVPQDYQFTANAEYRFFNLANRQDIHLGTLENQGYEAAYTRTEYNGKIYTLALAGNPLSESPAPLVLLAFDPAAGSMKKYTVSEYGFPYTSMAVSDGKLLIMNHEMDAAKNDKIYEFDPASENIRDVLSFTSETDSLRAVSSSADGFYLLDLKINSSAENELFLERYDKNYNKISEQSVNETLIKAVMEINGMTERQDALNELGMNVSRFAVEDDRYLIYENFGLTRVIADLQTGETLLAKDDLYSVSIGSGTPIFYRMDFDAENIEEPDIICMIDGKLEKLSFQPTDSHKLIRQISHSRSGTWMIMTSDSDSMQDSTFMLQTWTEH